MAFIYDLADTWNAAGTTFTAIKMNVTDTASAAGSLLMDLQVGGASRFSVRKDGLASFGGIALNVPGNIGLSLGTDLAAIRFGASGDLFVARDAANTLAQRNGVNAQAFRVYNTFTDASNYERGFVRYVSNQLEVGHEAAGTGSTSREFKLVGNAVKAGTSANPADAFYASANLFGLPSGSVLSWASNSTNAGTGRDTSLIRSAVGILGVRGTTNAVGASVEFVEQTAPAAPATNGVRIYAEDNGAGKTRLMALFATGAAVQIAIEP